MLLLDAAYADARDSLQLDVEYKAFREGFSRGGSGPSQYDLNRRSLANEIKKDKHLEKNCYEMTSATVSGLQQQNNLHHRKPLRLLSHMFVTMPVWREGQGSRKKLDLAVFAQHGASTSKID